MTNCPNGISTNISVSGIEQEEVHNFQYSGMVVSDQDSKLTRITVAIVKFKTL